MATRVDGSEQTAVAVSELNEGDFILVKPGESIPADGVVIEGTSSVDESLLTGESLPIRYQAGDKVIGGSVNIESTLQLQVKAIGQDTVLASIQRLLERAQSEKPRLAQLADRVASYFVFVILVISLAVGFYWWSVGSQDAFWIVISVLVVTCPCALSLATPTALTVATGQLTRLGMLTTRGHALETLSRLTHVVFDKTGTLTEGRLKLIDVKTHSQPDRDECLRLACSLERFSEHPIAHSILHAYANDDFHRVSDTENSPGQGLKGTINGERYNIGNIQFISEQIMYPLRTLREEIETFKHVFTQSDKLMEVGSEMTAYFDSILEEHAHNVVESGDGSEQFSLEKYPILIDFLIPMKYSPQRQKMLDDYRRVKNIIISDILDTEG